MKIPSGRFWCGRIAGVIPQPIDFHEVEYSLGFRCRLRPTSRPEILVNTQCREGIHKTNATLQNTSWLTNYANVISPSATITSSILFQERMTYPLYHYHITISYHHIQYTISREEDLPPMPISSHHQLQSHPVYCFKRGGLTNYINITSLSATVIFNIPFQEQMTYLLNWTYSIVIYQYPILSREHLHPELSLDVELTRTAFTFNTYLEFPMYPTWIVHFG